MTSKFIRAALATGLIFTTPAVAGAQTYLTPYAGVTGGGDTPTSKLSTGASLMFVDFVGLEIDFGYTPDFFDEQDGVALVADSNVTTLMASIVIAPIDGPVEPYVAAGAGLLRTRVDTDDLFDDVDSNELGMSFGGGVIGMFNDHIGVRGDIRYFRRLQDPEPDNAIDIEIGQFGFWRFTAGVSFKF